MGVYAIVVVHVRFVLAYNLLAEKNRGEIALTSGIILSQCCTVWTGLAWCVFAASGTAKPESAAKPIITQVLAGIIFLREERDWLISPTYRIKAAVQLLNCTVININQRRNITALFLSNCSIFRSFIFEQYILV